MDGLVATARAGTDVQLTGVPRFVGVSDDLTGALALGAELRAANVDVTVVPWNATPDVQTGALIFDTASRLLSARAAGDRVARLVRSLRLGPSTIAYKRIDSALRGNWPTETAAMVSVLHRAVIAAVAAPTLGVTVAHGAVLRDGSPIAQASSMSELEVRGATLELGFPPPIVTLPVASLRSHDVRSPLRGSVICDGATQQDLHDAARMVTRWPDVVVVGSYGLAREIGRLIGDRQQPGVLAVCGSYQEPTVRQLRVASEAGWLVEEAARVNAADVIDALRAGRHVALSSFDPVGPLPDRRVPEATGALAGVAASILEQARPAGLLLIGGELTSTVLGALGASRLEPLMEPWPTVPLVQVTLDGSNAMLAGAKSGSQGEPWWLVYAADAIVAWTRESRISRHSGGNVRPRP